MTNTTTKDVDLFSLKGDALAEKFGTTKEQLEEAQAVVQFVRLAASRIREMRESKGKSRAQLGAFLGVSEQRVAQLESGALRNAPNLKTLAKVANHLGYTCDVSVNPIGAVQIGVAKWFDPSETWDPHSFSFKAYPATAIGVYDQPQRPYKTK